MNQLPVIIKRRMMEKLLFEQGFERALQQKNHTLYKHKDGRFTTMPRYRSKKLALPVLKLILKEIHVEIDEYNEFVKNI